MIGVEFGSCHKRGEGTFENNLHLHQRLLIQKHGYSYEQALQGVSWEMKHYRANITERYLGG